MDAGDIANHHDRAAIAEGLLCRLRDKDQATHDRAKCVLHEFGCDVFECGGREGAARGVDDTVETAEHGGGIGDDRAGLRCITEVCLER